MKKQTVVMNFENETVEVDFKHFKEMVRAGLEINDEENLDKKEELKSDYLDMVHTFGFYESQEEFLDLIEL